MNIRQKIYAGALSDKNCSVNTGRRNPIVFVFFAGFFAGFFSVAIRLHSRELVPGEDAYFLWYVLTKTVVGAVGAVIIFIFLRTRVLDSVLMLPLRDSLRSGEPDVVLFIFAFISGFSERFIFTDF